jgi:hypothetical protein
MAVMCLLSSHRTVFAAGRSVLRAPRRPCHPWWEAVLRAARLPGPPQAATSFGGDRSTPGHVRAEVNFASTDKHSR